MNPRCPQCQESDPFRCKDVYTENSSCVWNLLYCSKCGHILQYNAIVVEIAKPQETGETIEVVNYRQKTESRTTEESIQRQTIPEPNKKSKEQLGKKETETKSRVTSLSTQELRNETLSGSSIEKIESEKAFSAHKEIPKVYSSNNWEKSELDDLPFLNPDEEVIADTPGKEVNAEDQGKPIYFISFSKNKQPFFKFTKEKIIRALSGGGMAETYLYESDFEGHDVVVIKVVKASDLFFERFKREIKIHSALRHKNIVQILEAGVRENFVYLVAEYADGGDLQALITRKTKLSVRTSMIICVGVVNALNYGWKEKALIHRDIKPANILIDKANKTVKLSDFGLAKFVNEVTEETKITQTGIALGTPCYCAPEQIDKFRDATYLSDIYSLGAVLYHMLTGIPPYSEELKKHSISYFFENTLHPEKLDYTDIPTPLKKIICTCMQSDPKKRYQDYGKLLDDLKSFYLLC